VVCDEACAEAECGVAFVGHGKGEVVGTSYGRRAGVRGCAVCGAVRRCALGRGGPRRIGGELCGARVHAAGSVAAVARRAASAAQRGLRGAA
jgi:hypothetical protein